MTADSFPTPDSSSPDQLASPPAPVPPPEQVPEAAAAGEGDGDGGGERRRIPIGTQRPGVRPPKLPPRHQFVASATSSVLGDTPLPPVRPAAPPAATEAVTSAASASVASSAAPVPSVSGPVVSAADIEARAAAAGGEAPRDARGGPRRGGDQGGDRPRRERRGDRAPASAFADVLPPSKRVAVPNLRASLEEDLEEDFQAAIEGIEVDSILATAASVKASATLDPGSRVSGTVVAVSPDTAFIDLGGRRQGALKLIGLDGNPEIGQVLELSVGGFNEEDGLYTVAPANRAIAVEDWSQIEAGMIVAAKVVAANKGGVECDVAGLRGFMPASLVSNWRMENLEELVGQTVEALVTEIVPAARRLVLSRRAVLERQSADARTKMLETLEIGDLLDGIVRSVRDFGAFVDVGNGVDGLVHVSQMSWDRVKTPTEVLEVGQKVRVAVKNVDRQTGKIGLSIRDTVESPWKNAAEKYHVGAAVRGTVSRIAQFGAFVRLEPGVEGLVHVSELAHRHVQSVSSVVREGEAVECKVLSCDPDEQRMSLSIKALATLPVGKGGPAAEPGEPEVEEAPLPPVKKSNAPLKGGIGRRGDGAKFGLQW
ncbi:MAG: S1 RNA-binding domain-containing protein [Planctomycetota bacterium]|nr:S1 RNA-binding domain-containing protein [Planctomycetota bacterium]